MEFVNQLAPPRPRPGLIEDRLPMHRITFFAIVVVSSLSAVSAASVPKFRVTDLGVLPGGTQSAANDINDAAVIVGQSTGPQSGAYAVAVVWLDGAPMELTGLGVSGATANAVNGQGRVVGISDQLGLNAFAWDAKGVDPLPAPQFCCSEATGINDDGVIVGRAAITGAGTPNEGVVWIDGEFAPLASQGFLYDVPNDINNDGVIVGTTFVSGAYRGVVWNDGVPTVLPSLGGFFSEATAINGSGAIVGHSEAPGSPTKAVTWVDGVIETLPALSIGFSMANAVNDAGWIVGVSATSSGGGRAVLWIDGDVHELQALVVNGPVTLFNASAVNNLGQIVGEGELGGAPRAFLLTPVNAADLDASGGVDGADLGGLLAAWGNCPSEIECPEDLTGDGAVDGADLGMLLAAWSTSD